MASGRVSFALSLHGLAASIDTACSSALVALHIAITSGCKLSEAIVAAANLVLSPHQTLWFARAGMLSREGRCKTFDALANGYVRSEAVGAATLGSCTPTRVRSRSLICIRSCAVRSDGRSASLTAPNGSAQANMVKVALTSAGVEALCLVEAHGTGTALGDPTEINSLGRVVGHSSPCLSGAKASLGHAEPTAGLLGLLVLTSELSRREGNINSKLHVLNGLLVPAGRAMHATFAQQATMLDSQALPAGVSSFGYSGTIAHAAVQESRAVSTYNHLSVPRLVFRCRWRCREATKPPTAAGTAHASDQSEPPSLPSPSIPAPSVELAILAAGELDSRGRERGNDLGTLVRIAIDGSSGVATIELNDPKRFNTMSWPLGDDMQRAVSFLSKRCRARALVWQAAGNVFCAGASPYSSGGPSSLAATARLIYDYKVKGFVALHTLFIPVVAAVQGAMVGGGVAMSLQADMRIAEAQATFQHGNLSRGVCPVAGFSHTLQVAIGTAHAATFYLTDEPITATAALALGLVQEVRDGVCEAKSRALALCSQLGTHGVRVLAIRTSVGEELLASEVISHTECLKVNGGLRLGVDAGRWDEGRPLLEENLQTLFPWLQHSAAPNPKTPPVGVVFWAVTDLLSTEAHALSHELDALPTLAAVHSQLSRSDIPIIFACHSHVHADIVMLGTIVLAHHETICRVSSTTFRGGPRGGAAMPRMQQPGSGQLVEGGTDLDALEAMRVGFVDVVGGAEELVSEVARLCRGLNYTQLPAREELASSPGGESSHLRLLGASESLSMDATTEITVAVISLSAELDESQMVISLTSSLTALACLCGKLRVVVLHLPLHFALLNQASAYSAFLVERAIKKLHALNVPVVCSACCELSGFALAIWLASDFRITSCATATSPRHFRMRSHSGQDLRSAHTSPLRAEHAPRLGQVSKLVGPSEDVGESALQFANWLSLHPPIGLKHMLKLTRVSPSSCFACHLSVAALARRHSLLYASTGHSEASVLGRFLQVSTADHELQSLSAARSENCLRLSDLASLRPSPSAHKPSLQSSAGPVVGVHALQAYLPGLCVSVAAFEAAEGAPKEAPRRLFEMYSACGEDEDASSMALTVVRRLSSRCGISLETVGQLCVGSTSLLDRSKSLKTELMALWEAGAIADVEGVSELTFCDADGLTVLQSCIDWVQSASWDGRLAVGVCADASNGPSGNRLSEGASAVALLVGPMPSVPVVGPILFKQWQCSTVWAFADVCKRKHASWQAMTPLSEALVEPGGEVEARFERQVAWSLTLLVRTGHRSAPARLAGMVGIGATLLAELDARVPLSPALFRARCAPSARGLGQFGWAARVSGEQRHDTYYLREVALPPPDSALMGPSLPATSEALRMYEYMQMAPLQYVSQAVSECAVTLHTRSQDTPGAALQLSSAASNELLSQLTRAMGTVGAAPPAPVHHVTSMSIVSYAVHSVVDEFMPGVSSDTPLLEAGLDSLGAVELRNRLAACLSTHAELPEVMVFDFPTARRLEAHLHQHVQEDICQSAHQEGPSMLAPFQGEGAASLLLTQLLWSIGSTPAMHTASGEVETSESISSAVRLSIDELLPDVALDTPLMDAGLDSLGAVELRNRLLTRLGDYSLALPETLIFDFPTMRRLEAHLQANIRPEGALLPSSGTLEVLTSRIRSASSAPATNVRISLTGGSCSLPGDVSSTALLSRAAATACNLVLEVPFLRWDANEVSERLDPSTAIRTRHGSFVTDAQLFDNRHFSISLAEAAAMDPQQRLLLESSYGAMHASGFSRAELLGRSSGVAVGICWSEFVQLLAEEPFCRTVYAATGGALSIASGRISFVLGLHGPCTSFETACSSSIVACHAAAHAVRDGESEEHLVAGVNLMLLRSTSTSIAVASMTAVAGRCRTFDNGADGFARGEGCGALVLQRCHSLLAVQGTSSQQDGRSASLTAPSGQAQQGLLRAALASAALHPAALVLHEAHGTGTALGDPIEVRSFAAVALGSQARSEALVLMGVKSSSGHAEATAGLVGILRLGSSLDRGGATNAQLRMLNLHVRGALHGDCTLPTQLAEPSFGVAINECVSGSVSSFGYNGTIALAAVHAGREDEGSTYVDGPNRCDSPQVSFRCLAFPWQSTPHPFLQVHFPPAHSMPASFRSPAAGALRALVSGHVVRGRIIFPAAGYLEAARGVHAATFPLGGTLSLLHGVMFLRPLVLVGADLQLVCTVGEGQLEIRSDHGAASITEVAVHCTSGVGRNEGKLPGWSTDSIVVAASRCASAIELPALYGTFSSGGLEYGPTFRTLLRAWTSAGTSSCSMVRLRSRQWRSHGQCSWMHPADLDGALQLSATSGVMNEMQLPFAVIDAALQCNGGEQWAVRKRESQRCLSDADSAQPPSF